MGSAQIAVFIDRGEPVRGRDVLSDSLGCRIVTLSAGPLTVHLDGSSDAATLDVLDAITRAVAGLRHGVAERMAAEARRKGAVNG